MKYCWQADPDIHHLVEAIPEHKPHFWVVKTLQPQDTVSTAACHRSHSSAHHGFSEVWSISSSVWRAENLKIWHLFWGWGDVHVKLLPGMFTTKKLWEAMRRGLQHVTTLSSFHLFPKLQSKQTFPCCAGTCSAWMALPTPTQQVVFSISLWFLLGSIKDGCLLWDPQDLRSTKRKEIARSLSPVS